MLLSVERFLYFVLLQPPHRRRRRSTLHLAPELEDRRFSNILFLVPFLVYFAQQRLVDKGSFLLKIKVRVWHCIYCANTILYKDSIFALQNAIIFVTQVDLVDFTLFFFAIKTFLLFFIYFLSYILCLPVQLTFYFDLF